MVWHQLVVVSYVYYFFSFQRLLRLFFLQDSQYSSRESSWSRVEKPVSHFIALLDFTSPSGVWNNSDLFDDLLLFIRGVTTSQRVCALDKRKARRKNYRCSDIKSNTHNLLLFGLAEVSIALVASPNHKHSPNYVIDYEKV